MSGLFRFIAFNSILQYIRTVEPLLNAKFINPSAMGAGSSNLLKICFLPLSPDKTWLIVYNG
ncbi:MAG: hypothetical protein D4R64_03840 [Porphyromonadaceae bacterium]|nr:MAG: hypothetical protein D4R64_03840 [Porphyromonadaceae bacterium]